MLLTVLLSKAISRALEVLVGALVVARADTAAGFVFVGLVVGLGFVAVVLAAARFPSQDYISFSF
jgi:hypothetical protein